MICDSSALGVIPIIIGPLQVLLAILPGLLASLGVALLALLKPSAIRTAARLLWHVKIPAGITVLLVVAGMYPWVFFSKQPTKPAAENSLHDWPMFRGGPDRLGTVPATASPLRGGINWSFDPGRESFFSSPAVVGNRIYIASAKLSAFGQGSGTIYCLDADTGALIWKYQPDAYRPTFSSPSIHVRQDGRRFLVIGEGLHVTTDGRVICLDITNEENIRLLWQFRTASHVESSPCLAYGRVYIGAGDDGYYCFELEPDEHGNARQVWHVSGSRYGDCETSPVVHEGKVYVGLGAGGNALCCLEASSGSELWRIETPLPVLSPPAIGSGRIFVGMGEGNFVQTADDIKRADLIQGANEDSDNSSPDDPDHISQLPQSGGEIFGISIANPQDHWKLQVPDTVIGSVAVTNDRLFFVTQGGEIYCVQHDGKELARWNAHSPIVASPACTDKYVYIVTATGAMYALDNENLKPNWEFQIPASGNYPSVSSPVLARGHVYLGTESSGVVSLGQPESNSAAVWQGYEGGAGRAGRMDDSPLPQDPVKLWPKKMPVQPDTILAPSAAGWEMLYVPIAGGSRRGLACLKTAPGRQIVQQWFHKTPNGIVLPPAAGSGKVFCIDGAVGDAGRFLYCLDDSAGSELWRMPVAEEASGELALLDGELAVEIKTGVLSCLGLDGKQLWQREIGPLAGPPACSGAILLACLKSPPSLFAMDRLSGKTLWQIPLDAAPTGGPALLDKTVLVGTTESLQAHALIDGSLMWVCRNGPLPSRFAVNRDCIAYVDNRSRLVLIDPNDGKRLCSQSDQQALISSVTPMIVGGGNILFATQQDLIIREVAGSYERQWMDISWLGTVTSPMIMLQSRLYFATDKYGLICVGQW